MDKMGAAVRTGAVTMSELKPCYSVERCNLVEHVPLSTPFAITLAPSTACIFKCCYCPHSIPGTPFVKKNMMWDTFTKIVEQIQEFDTKLKAIHIQGMGEPLINKDLPKMIAYIKERDIADQLNLITNGALLTKQYSLNLIASGLDTIKISLQGLTAEKYYETSRYRINMQKLIDDIAFLYKNKKKCQIYVKVADISLDEGDKEKFFKTFTPISDRANLEYIRPMYDGINYEERNIVKTPGVNIYAQYHPSFEVCSMGFFMMYINSMGDVYPCCNYRDPAGWGNIHSKTLRNIWNSDTRKDFLKMMVRKERYHQDKYPICTTCYMPDAMLKIEDNLNSLQENDLL